MSTDPYNINASFRQELPELETGDNDLFDQLSESDHDDYDPERPIEPLIAHMHTLPQQDLLHDNLPSAPTTRSNPTRRHLSLHPSESSSQSTVNYLREVEELRRELAEAKRQMRLNSHRKSMTPAPYIDASKGVATNPESFNGDREKLRLFITQCNMFFSLKGSASFPTEAHKVIYAGGLLRGTAFDWFEAYFNSPNPPSWLKDWSEFVVQLNNSFGGSDRRRQAASRLRTLEQKTDVTSYWTQFQKWSTQTNWNEDAKVDMFREGLKPGIKAALALMLDEPTRLERLVEVCAQIDQQQYLANRTFAPTNSTRTSDNSARSAPSKSSSTGTESTQMPKLNENDFHIVDGKRKLKNEVITYRITNDLCVICGGKHTKEKCPRSRENRAAFKAAIVDTTTQVAESPAEN